MDTIQSLITEARAAVSLLSRKQDIIEAKIDGLWAFIEELQNGRNEDDSSNNQ